VQRSCGNTPRRDETKLRRYRTEDLEATVRMWCSVRRVAYPYLELDQRYTLDENLAFFRDHVAPRCQIWLAERGAEIVGFLAIEASYVDRLYVAVSHQRSGIGTALLAKAKELSPASLSLHTHRQNREARAFYEKHGFRAARFGVSPAPESVPDVEYRWQAQPGAHGVPPSETGPFEPSDR
jgi:ribosomal protein S18 acetylase RimI-like enzyme